MTQTLTEEDRKRIDFNAEQYARHETAEGVTLNPDSLYDYREGAIAECLYTKQELERVKREAVKEFCEHIGYFDLISLGQDNAEVFGLRLGDKILKGITEYLKKKIEQSKQSEGVE